MLSLNERPTLKAGVECANRELESKQNNNVLKKRLEEEAETRPTAQSLVRVPQSPFM